ncbi:MAG: 50S ribosomal protein L19e [Candidatus Nanoarchaeia archaeon]
MNLTNQKVLAAKIAKVGINRVIFTPENLNEIKEALTKADISALIKKGAIKILPAKTPSRVRAKKRHLQRVKGRQKGPGSRKGTRISKKELWMQKVRALRLLLKTLKKQNKITPKVYEELRKKVKGNFFRSRAHLLLYLKQNNLLK